MAQCFVVTERTVLSKTNNTEGLWWQHKVSVTCNSAPAHLLRLQAMHQRFHRYIPRYVPRIYFVSGVDNIISDFPSRSLDLTNNQLLTYLDTNFPLPLPWQLWTKPPKIVSGIALALRNKTSERGCVLEEPPLLMANGPNGHICAQGWPSTPY